MRQPATHCLNDKMPSAHFASQSRGLATPPSAELCPLNVATMLLQGAEAGTVCVSVLLHGPSGCGKSTAVSAAAAALGLNVVPYSCHDFIGQSDAAVAMTVKAALENAQEFAPAVLYLEDFSALCSAEQAQGSAPGAAPLQVFDGDAPPALVREKLLTSCCRALVARDSTDGTICCP